MHSLLFFIIALSILVVVHEFGHFWVARRCGVKVLIFSVGFGKPVWQHKGQDGTVYQLAMIPLGGYVKMLDEREGEVAAAELIQAFNRQSLRARTAIVLAGPVANLLFAVFAFWIVFSFGISGIKPIVNQVVAESPAAQSGITAGSEIVAVNGVATPTWRSVGKSLQQLQSKGEHAQLTLRHIAESYMLDFPIETATAGWPSLIQQLGFEPVQVALQPVVGKVAREGAAPAAGLQMGDFLLSANNETIVDWQQWVSIVRAHANKPLVITVRRDNEHVLLTITPERVTEAGKDIGKIGAGVDAAATDIPDNLRAKWQYSPLAAVKIAVLETWTFSTNTLTGIGGMIVGLVSADQIGGPVAIAQFASASASQGFVSFMGFLAMISISLGVLNLLPIPMLDGGHLAFYVAEAIRGKPMPDKFQMAAQQVGLVLLLLLMAFAFTNHLTRIVG